MAAVIGSLRVNLGIDTAAFSDGLKKAQSSLAVWGKRAAIAGAAAATAAGIAMGAAVGRTIDAADEMEKAAQKFGVPIETLSRLKYAADMSDVSMETLGTSFGILSKNIVAASRDSTGPAAEAFERLGIALQDAEGNLRPPTDVLMDLADALSEMEDTDPTKAATMMELLGRGC